MIDLERFKEIQPQLKAWFPPEAHVERELPGGSSTWYFVPWQLIRERLDEVAPDWQMDYNDPVYLEDMCVIQCSITICGITRKAPGNAPIKLISGKGKDMARGTPVERAVADAFKNAAEAFGICRYLDEQADKKTKEAFVRHMRSGGNGKAGIHYRSNEEGKPAAKPAVKPSSKPFGQSKQATKPVDANKPISVEQCKRFWAIARQGSYTDGAVRKLLETYQLTSTQQITVGIYDEICRKAGDPDFAAIYNKAALTMQSVGTGNWEDQAAIANS
jgi:hypothetical protein